MSKEEEEKKDEIDENGPITEDDIRIDAEKLAELNKNNNNINNDNNNKKSEEKKENSSEIFKDIVNELKSIITELKNNDPNKNMYNLIDKFKKNKYKEELLKNNLPIEIENSIINELNNIYDFYNNNNNHDIKIFLEFLFDLYEILPYFYHPEPFEILINYEDFNDENNFEKKVNSIDFLKLFENIYSKNNMNLIIDKLILFLYKNYSDYKSLYIENNLLINYPSRSVFISFKFICLHLFLYNKIIQNVNNFNISLYIESLSNVAKILLQESSYYNQKFNNEFFNNVFADFDFNADDKIKRKLNNEEFKFLTKNLFKFLFIIIFNYYKHITIKFDFISNENRMIFWKFIDCHLNGNFIYPKNENEINIYSFYILFSFILDILSFIYTNFLYLNKETYEQKEFHLNNYDPFFIFVNSNDWKNPNFHLEFINYAKDIFISHCSDLIKFIEIFLILCDIKTENKENYEKAFQFQSNHSYFIIQPMNSVGIGCLAWILNKINKYKNYNLIYNLLYIFDVHLPLIAALLKTGHSLKYLALETLFDFIEICKEKPLVKKMENLSHYSFDDVFDDILEFIGSQENDYMRKYVNLKIPKIIGILGDEAKMEFFNYFVENAFKFGEDKILNDEKISYFIQIIKKTMNENLNNENKIFWKENFIKKIINSFVFNYEKIFIFDIIETISQGINFICFVILKDKNIFEGKLNIYSKDFLYENRRKFNEIISLVEKFMKSSEEEKYKSLNLNFHTQNDDNKKIFKMKINQCQLLLNLINDVDNLIMKCLKEIENNKN